MTAADELLAAAEGVAAAAEEVAAALLAAALLSCEDVVETIDNMSDRVEEGVALGTIAVKVLDYIDVLKIVLEGVVLEDKRMVHISAVDDVPKPEDTEGVELEGLNRGVVLDDVPGLDDLSGVVYGVV